MPTVTDLDHPGHVIQRGHSLKWGDDDITVSCFYDSVPEAVKLITSVLLSVGLEQCLKYMEAYIQCP